MTKRSCAAPISKVKSHISKRCSHYIGWLFVVPRKSYRIELLFTHKNRCDGAICVKRRSCAASISKVKSHISDRCSYYIGQLLCVNRTHIRYDFRGGRRISYPTQCENSLKSKRFDYKNLQS